MTVTALPIVQSKYIEAANTVQFTAIALTVIDAATVVNTSAASVSISISIVESGGVLSGGSLSIDSRTLQAGETYQCPELVGQVLAVGDYVSAVASAATSANIRISGREIT